MFGAVKRPLRQLAEYFGIQAEDKPRYLPASHDMSDYEYPSFAQGLPYELYDEKSQIFYNTYSSGLIYRITPLTGGNEAIAEQLDGILRTKISDVFTFQVILVKHNQVGPQIERFARQFKSDQLPGMARLGESLSNYYQRAAIEGFKTLDETKARLTQSEVYLVVDQANQKRTEQEIRLAFDQFRIDFEATLTASNIGFSVCDAIDFLHLISFYTRHNTQDIYPIDIDYVEAQLLKQQVNDRSFELEVDQDGKDHLRLSGTNDQGRHFETDISVLTMEKLPGEFCLWQNIDAANNIFNKEYGVNCNHIISVTYVLDSHQKALSKANHKTRDLTKKSKGDYKTVVAGVDEQLSQWQQFREDLNKQKTRACKMLYNVILFSKKGERQNDVAKAVNSFGLIGLKLCVPKRMQLPYFLASMPFMFTDNLKHDFSLPTMMQPISSWNATQYMPVLSDWQGQSGGVLLPSMRGQFAMIDQFSGVFGANYNCAVTGTSGAGKSFLMQMMMLNVLFSGGNVYVIDIGGSYKKLCEALGGTYLNYSNLAMNPFTHIEDINESIDGLIDLFELLACPKKGASDQDASSLRLALLNAFAKKGKGTLIDDVQSELENLYDPDRYPTARILAANIDKYTSKAEHGKAFNLPSKLDPNARLIVIDLLEIGEQKNLIAPVLLSVFSQYSARIYGSDRNIKKLCLIDEAWKFFEGDPRAIQFLVQGFRTGRRHNASFVTVTQGVNDYFKFSEAKQLWENAALKFVLLQDTATLDEFNKKYELFTPFEIGVLKQFPTASKAGYSEVQIRGGGLSTFQRLFVDPFTLVMLSSKGEDFDAVEKLKEQGVALLDAVEQVARKHYGRMY